MIYVTHDQVEAMTMADKIVVLRDGVIEQAGAPLDLYNRPANRFVAGFIGSPRMNFIDVTVETRGPDGVGVTDAAGNRYAASVSPEGLAVGDAAVLGIRPDHLEIAGEGGVPVTVQAIEQLGGESYLYCETATGARLTAHLSGQTGIRRGETAHALFRPDFTHLFRTDTGVAQQRLRVGEAV
jgi:ABC-type sugar transport system ATPase subunit